MSKTILIGVSNKFSSRANKWLFQLTGLLLFVNGGFDIHINNHEPIGTILGVIMLIGGICYIFYGFVGFSENSKFASKIKVDESVIELKNNFWRNSTKLNWSELSSIKFQSYEIIFQLRDSSNSFSYNSNSDVSRIIKQTIRAFAERKNIEVIGG